MNIEITLLNTDFEAIDILDNYKSFIWNDRYNEAGDFELCIPIGSDVPNNIRKGYYIENSNSDRTMIIETLTIDSDEDGTYLMVSGKSLESLLSRRIVWNKTVFSMNATTGEDPNLQNGLKTLFDANLIDPAIRVRRLDNFVFKLSDDEKVKNLTFEGEYLGEDLYEIVTSLCREKEIGFKLTRDTVYTNTGDGIKRTNTFVFELFAGVDRSYEQSTNDYVIFSKEFDNVISTNYLDSDSSLKNVTLIVGESTYNEDGTEDSRIEYTLNIAPAEGEIPTGIERREVFTDATNLSTTDEYGGVLSADQYKARLKQKGIDTLMENTSVTAFEGDIETDGLFKYGIDFFIGDIVQITNEYDKGGQARVTEFIMSCDGSGVYTYPTFTAIQKGVYETT